MKSVAIASGKFQHYRGCPPPPAALVVQSTVAGDWTFHQIAPYIGRMKTSMARSLIQTWTHQGDLVFDPFCGCGSVALEAAANGRRVVAGDWNSYGALLTRAKLFPVSLRAAERRLAKVWKLSRERIAEQDLRAVPPWVRRFFNPQTLRSALAFRDASVETDEYFLLACLLGILHHQRPGSCPTQVAISCSHFQ